MSAAASFAAVARGMRKPEFDENKLKLLVANFKMACQATAESIAETEPDVDDATLKAQIVAQMRAFADGPLGEAHRGILRLQAIKAGAEAVCKEAALLDDYEAEIAARAPAVTAAAVAAASAKERADLAEALQTAAGDGEGLAVIGGAGGAQAAGDRLKCKITRTTFKDPVRNSACPHVYERSAILSLQKPPKRWTCPGACVSERPVR